MLDTARKLFIENGFHGTGVAQIAARSGIKVGQIYRDFSSKEDIIAAIVNSDCRSFLGRRNAAPRDPARRRGASGDLGPSARHPRQGRRRPPPVRRDPGGSGAQRRIASIFNATHHDVRHVDARSAGDAGARRGAGGPPVGAGRRHPHHVAGHAAPRHDAARRGRSAAGRRAHRDDRSRYRFAAPGGGRPWPPDVTAGAKASGSMP